VGGAYAFVNLLEEAGDGKDSYWLEVLYLTMRRGTVAR